MPAAPRLRLVLRIGLVAIVLLCCTQRGLELHLGGGSVPLRSADLLVWSGEFCTDHSHSAVRLTYVDILVWPLLALVLLARTLRLRSEAGSLARALPRLRREFSVPLPLAGYFGVLILAGIYATSKAAACSEIIQAAGSFLAGYLFFLLLLRGDDEEARTNRRLALRALFVAGAISILTALTQYIALPDGARGWEARAEVRGLFEHANPLGLFLALVVPLAVGVLLAGRRRDWGLSLVLGLGVLLVFVVVISAGPFVALVSGALATAALFGERKLALFAAGLVVALALVLGLSPRGNGRLLHDSARVVRAPREGEDPVLAVRYRTREAQLRMILKHPWLGVGPGCLQREIAPFYAPRGVGSRPEGATDDPENWDVLADERYTFPMHLVVACETGLVGLGVLIWLLVSFAARALRGFVLLLPDTDGEEPLSADSVLCRGVLAGTVGALVAMLVAGAFTSPLVRSVWTALALVMALSVACHEAALLRLREEAAGEDGRPEGLLPPGSAPLGASAGDADGAAPPPPEGPGGKEAGP